MKRVIGLILAVALVMGLISGCGSSKSSDSSSAANSSSAQSAQEVSDKDVKTTIKVWQFEAYTDIESKMKDLVIKSFSEQYKNVNVELEILNGDTGPEKISVAMGAGSTPDLLLDIASRVTPAITKNLTAPLTDIRKELGDVLPESVVKSGLVNGEYYYLPTALARGYHMTVNMGLAQELGVDNLLPADHKTWSYDDFLKLCRETVKAGKSKGIKAVPLYAGSQSSDSMYYSFMMTGGADIINADHTAAVANSPAGIKFFDLLKTIVDEELCLPGAATLKDVDLPAYFNSGKVLILLSAAGYGASLDAEKGIKEGAVVEPYKPEAYMYPTPDGKGTPKVLTFGSNGAVVFKNQNDKDKIEVSKRLLKELITNKAYCQNLSDMGTVNFGDVNYTYPNDWVKQQADYANTWDTDYATSDNGVATLETWWGDVRAVFYPELQALYTGNKSSQQALDDFVKNANAAIAAAAKK